MPEPLIPGCPLPDPEIVRARISDLDDQAAVLRRLLRLILRIKSRCPDSDRTSITSADRQGVTRG